MAEDTQAPGDTQKRHVPFAALIALFLASGATSLVYETIWARQLQLVFGASQLAVATVLAAFMAGLAGGALAGARLGERATHPLRVYAWLEGAIGLYALAFPGLLTGVAPLYAGFAATFEPGPLLFGGFQLAVVGILLLPPTLCMGATLPVLARFVRHEAGRSGRDVGALYGANTLGAVLGAGLAGFALLPSLGLSATTLACAAANGGLALLAGALAHRTAAPKPRLAEPEAPAAAKRLLALAALCGFAALLYEVSWFRLLTLILGGSAYSFTIMLVAFLVGIGAGGWAGGFAADRAAESGGRTQLLREFAAIQAGIAVLASLALLGYGQLPFVFTWLFHATGSAPALLFPAEVLLAIALMLPPALGMGAAFTYLVRIAARPGRELCAPVGRLYAANTLGGVAGAVAGGFALLPWLHLRGAVQAASWLELIASFAALMLARTVVRGRVRAESWPAAACAVLAGVTLLVPAWNPLLMSSGMFLYASNLENGSRAAVIEASVRPYELLFYDEGLSSVVTVARDRESGNTWLAHNGNIDASSHFDLATQVLLAHLPMLFRPDAERAMVLGLASGMTAGSLTLHPAPVRIDLVEIEPLVIDALPFFDDYNHQPLRDPRTRVFLNDARNHLMRMPDASYDVVTAEPSNPWLSGVASLFTREFFELGRRKLAKGGVWAQWLHTYGMGEDDLRSLLATFAAVHDHVRLFSIDDSDLVLVGSAEPLVLDTDGIRRALAGREAVQDDLIRAGIRSPVDVLAHYQFDRDAIVWLTQGVELNTDDNMRIEYAAPLRLHDDTVAANLALLASVAEVPVGATHALEELVALAARYGDAGDWDRSLRAIREAEASDPAVAEISRVLHELARKADRPSARPGSGE